MNSSAFSVPHCLAAEGIDICFPQRLTRLINDLFLILSRHDAPLLPQQIAQAAKPGADFSAVPDLFTSWLLMDETHGLTNLIQCTDIKIALVQVGLDHYSQAHRIARRDESIAENIQFAAATRDMAWAAYEAGQDSPQSSQLRIDWMAASAAAHTSDPHLCEPLSDTVFSAAVAWATATSPHGTPRKSCAQFYRDVRDQLLALMDQQAADFCYRDRVRFCHPEHGWQTGSFVEIVKNSKPTRALVIIDHHLKDIIWTVPVKALTKLQARAA